jgi:hypothetical protein
MLKSKKGIPRELSFSGLNGPFYALNGRFPA